MPTCRTSGSSPPPSAWFDINDFDETLPGPWEWDVKRLVASVEIAGRDRGFTTAERHAAVEFAARSYRETMRQFADMTTLDVWYAHADVRRRAQLRQAARPVGKSLTSFQIVQQRLVHMLADVTAMQLYCVQIAKLAEGGKLTRRWPGWLSCTTPRRPVACSPRPATLLGGNGILLDFHVIRHMVDIEAIHTFEGTETIQTLIVGRDITGVGAFA